MKNIIKPISILLIHAMAMAQLTTGKSTVLAFAGIQVENVEPWMEEELQKKMESIFDGLEPEMILLPLSVRSQANEQVDSLFSDMNDATFQRIADETGAKYVFSGQFKNVSPDEKRIMIQGDFYRYNAILKSSFRYEVLKYYERMNDETKVIKTQLVDSIPATAKPASLKQVAMVFGSILLVGILFMSITGTKVWGEASGGNDGIPPTET